MLQLGGEGPARGCPAGIHVVLQARAIFGNHAWIRGCYVLQFLRVFLNVVKLLELWTGTPAADVRPLVVADRAVFALSGDDRFVFRR